MKKWMFVVGILSCSILFFLSGTLFGLFTSEKAVQEAKEADKPVRKPSKTLNPIIGRIVQTQVSRYSTRTRVPTPSAVIKARQYKAEILGN